uniref:ATP synthase complex subunit 8 n=1 Tax=Kaylathalia klovstadi TaxID=2778773 RepID=A0A7T6Y735_9HEXA|nr:ATP synthase F0 subunit 8 [Kaylathalia klovstadi]QQK54734.1 ATP synthase F0 subunit 8 [Kaylathalia klovstadi]
MPQMAPLSWLTLFSVFIVIYMLNATKIYFSSTNTTAKKTNGVGLAHKTPSWKW